MNKFTFEEGSSPLLISIPHSGCVVPEGIAKQMTQEGSVLRDTDWYIPRLYDFVRELDASVVETHVSRYVVDLNRDPQDRVLYQNYTSTGVCPTHHFDGTPIYRDGFIIDKEEKSARISQYWQPYHEKLSQMLNNIRSKHGFAFLWDAHSIRSKVPKLFQGVLPELNIGTNDSSSCDVRIQGLAYEIARRFEYSVVVNGRFKGGFITRQYGKPSEGIHALQMEISQRTYMNETPPEYDDALAPRLQEALHEMLISCTAKLKEIYT
ncbi:MAG: N-formylglutamate deformylase [Gammaproteobacteria bacterium]|nr:N-formylglutamate deformylase [Gammaproteobacteria bacterium]